VGLVFVSRDPNASEGAAATRVTVECHGPNAEPDNLALAAWLQKSLSSRKGAHDIWTAEWIIDDPIVANEFENDLSSQATLRGRVVSTGDPARVGAILANGPSPMSSEELEWTLRWFPGMENAAPRYAKVVVLSSNSLIAAYAAVYPHGTFTTQPSDWFRRQVSGRPAAPARLDSSGQPLDGFLVEDHQRKSLLAALQALPPTAVERFSAKWELGSDGEQL
jgi:hypothetical protein